MRPKTSNAKEGMPKIDDSASGTNGPILKMKGRMDIGVSMEGTMSGKLANSRRLLLGVTGEVGDLEALN
jgi:hypothetical protein